MNKCLSAAFMGLMIGIYIGYSQEEELSNICHSSHRNKKKMMRKIHKTYDHICDCMDKE